jgi:putative hydrolase of the HAD superfamily
MTDTAIDTVIETIFVDFDGVIRHWEPLQLTARAANVSADVLFSVAFEPECLSPAITGQCSHEEWVQDIADRLRHQHGAVAARTLISAWAVAEFTIDHAFLNAIRQQTAGSALALVTNATSRLARDLQHAQLSHAFDHVINSSELGVAKPDTLFYLQALQLARTVPERSVFIDDSRQNVEAAKALGFHAWHHQDPPSTLAFLAGLDFSNVRDQASQVKRNERLTRD